MVKRKVYLGALKVSISDGKKRPMSIFCFDGELVERSEGIDESDIQEISRVF